jgi:hypothetical protein
VRDYTVDTAKDDPALLRDKLHSIAREGLKVISIQWVPKRNVVLDNGDYDVNSGYVIVSEKEA